MTALQILRQAYASGIAPAHLRGRTQHKTLQARLSEDILERREESRFYRTAPGRFLLSELLDDPSIPPDERRPIVTRRRRRDLPTDRALAFNHRAVLPMCRHGVMAPASVLALIDRGAYHYTSNAKRKRSKDVVLWSFVVVIKDQAVLTYRQGAYRESRDSFMLRRTIGFYSPVVDTDNTLFERHDHGIVSSGIRALATDLGLAHHSLSKSLSEKAALHAFICPGLIDHHTDLLAVVSCVCPDWLEPTSRRLAINDLKWMDLRAPPNHTEDFDPWSQAILSEARRIAIGVSQ